MIEVQSVPITAFPPSAAAAKAEASAQALKQQKEALVLLAKNMEASLGHVTRRATAVADFRQRIADAQRTLEAGTPSVQTLARIDGLVLEVQTLMESERTHGADLDVIAHDLRVSLMELSQWKHQLPVWGHNVGASLKMLDGPPLSVGELRMLAENVESARNELRRVRAGYA